jgi:hypothetical protein
MARGGIETGKLVGVLIEFQGERLALVTIHELGQVVDIRRLQVAL